MKTAERILVFSLELFNQHGEANISSVDIANELDISPGNLYYHFKGKEIIIATLFDMHYQQMSKALLAPEKDAFTIDEFFLYLLVIFDLLYTYRFLYRNPAEIFEKYPSIINGFRRLLDAKEKVFYNSLDDLAEKNILLMDKVQLKNMVELISLIGTQTANYHLLKGKDINEGGYIKQSLLMLLFSLSPFINTSHTEIEQLKSSIESFKL